MVPLAALYVDVSDPGPAVGNIQCNTPGVQVSLCCSQMMLAERVETKWHGDESRI